MTFQWGALIFKGAMTSLTCAYKLFRPDGEPIRADVKLTLKQARPSRSGPEPDDARPGRLRRAPVRDGDTLPSISYRAYGDATRWRLIAEANGVDNPLHLRRGSSLALPALEN